MIGDEYNGVAEFLSVPVDFRHPGELAPEHRLSADHDGRL